MKLNSYFTMCCNRTRLCWISIKSISVTEENLQHLSSGLVKTRVAVFVKVSREVGNKWSNFCLVQSKLAQKQLLHDV